MKILWLTSWYPNPYEPYNGDFVQRHAKAVSEIIPIDVIHILQHGGRSKREAIVTKHNALTEYFHAFDFTPTGIDLIDKIRYNISYHKHCRSVLEAYIKKNGKPDIVHVHVPVKAGLMALYLLKKYKLPYLVSEQSSHYETTSPFYYFKRSKYYQNNCRRIYNNATAVTNVSATIGKKLQEIFTIKNYRTIHNLVDTELFHYKKAEPSDNVRLIHVSALGEQKNPTGMIKALAILQSRSKNWECTICGPANEQLKALVKENNLSDNIKFTGEIPYNKVAHYMNESDVFLLFSNHENFPCVVVEALCSGLPVVSSVAGGIAEAVNDSNGLLVPAGDNEALADALHSMITNLHKYNREVIAANSAKLYNKKLIAQQFVDLYNEVAGNQ